MPAPSPTDPAKSAGIHIGDVGGSLNFSALGDVVGGDKITTITTTIQVSVEAVTQKELNTASPYRGLDRFEDRDKDLFFGRDQLIKSLLSQLGASNVLLVLGASGSGKSSVVRAGLLPQLSQLIGARFRYFIFVPDVNPFESLRGALQGGGFSQTQTRELLDAAPETPARLLQTLRREGEQWLLFVDQFEEIFTVCAPAPREAFIAALLALARDTTSPAKLVLAMRSDFLDRFSRFPDFAKVIQKEINLVADMHADELRMAIEQPAARHGVVFEQGLVEEIIKDVQGQAGSLPLLQYTLDLLWHDELGADGHGLDDGRRLRAQAYRELGGVRGALQKRANEIYGSLGDAGGSKAASPKQKIVRQIFLRLVDLAGQGSNAAAWQAVRRRTPMADFTTAQEQEILRLLIDRKLLVSNREGDNATVEVAHEALFTSWERLKNWIEAGKQVIFTRNRLADDAGRWDARRQKSEPTADEELLGGSRLSQALEMRARGDFTTVVGGLGETETQFLDASAALRDRRAEEERARQQRELEAAHRLAAARKLTARLTAAGLVVACFLAYFGFSEAKKARDKNDALIQQQSVTAAARSRSDQETASRLSASHQPAAALAYLARSLENDPGNLLALSDALSVVFNTPWLIPGSAPVRLKDEIESVSFSPDATRILVNSPASEDTPGWRLYSRSDSNQLGLVTALDCQGRKDTLAFSSDGRRILGLSLTDRALRWDSEHGASVSDKGSLTAFSPKSPYHTEIKNGAGPGFVQIFNRQNAQIAPPLFHTGKVVGAWVSPDGKHAVTSDEGRELDAHVYVWRLGSTENDVATEPSYPLHIDYEAQTNTVRFSPGGRFVAMDLQQNGYDGPKITQLYRLDSSSTNESLISQAVELPAKLRVADFSSDGRFAVTALADGELQLWRMADPPPTEAKSSGIPVPDAMAGSADPGLPGVPLSAADLAEKALPGPPQDLGQATPGWTDPSGTYILFPGKTSLELWNAKTKDRTVLNLPVGGFSDPKVLFSSDEHWVTFRTSSDQLNVVALPSGTRRTIELKYDSLSFSKSGRFLMTVFSGTVGVEIIDTTNMAHSATCYRALEQKLWATEAIIAMKPTPELCRVLTALGGRRMGPNGGMENVPTAEWLRLRKETREDKTLANAVARWLLKWPESQSSPPF